MAIIDKAKGYEVDSRVTIALDALDEGQKRIINRVLSDKAHFVRSTNGSGRVQRLSPQEPLYALRGPDNLRIIYTKNDDGIVVMDLMQKQTLSQFGRRGRPKLRKGLKVRFRLRSELD